MVSKKTVLCTLYTLLLIGGLFVDVTPVNATPSTVATSTDGTPTAFPVQRKTFYAASRHWVFYSDDGDNLVLKTSTDGSTWSGATAICPSATGYYFSVWFDGTYVHYAREYPTNFDLYYRRGTPNSDGTITWSAVEQQIHDGITSDKHTFPVISVDTDGYVWIGTSYSGTLPYVWKNANTDGTWSTEAGFPYQLSATTGNWFVTPIPLTGGKVYVLYCKAATVPYGKLYNAGWGSEESDLADYTNEQYFTYSAVAIGDDIYFTYNRDVNQIRFNKRTYGTGWGAVDVLVQDTVESTTVPILHAQTATSELYVFWVLISTDHVYYKKYSGGSWDVSATDWIDESTDDFSVGYSITCFYEDFGNKVGVVYSTKLASPYNIRYDFLSFNSAPTAPTLTAPVDASMFNPSEVVDFAWTFNDPDEGDTQGAYQIQFDDNADFSSTYYDSGKVTSSSSSILVTAPSVAGTYYWRVKTWDAADAEGEWSSSRTFIIPVGTTPPTGGGPGGAEPYVPPPLDPNDPYDDIDTDGDGLPDWLDDDDDNDGIPDDLDPDDDNDGIPDEDELDTDGDGIPDDQDPDDDGDGIPDDEDLDDDGDGIPDEREDDTDDDGIRDDWDGDIDGDGIPNHLDDDPYRRTGADIVTVGLTWIQRQGWLILIALFLLVAYLSLTKKKGKRDPYKITPEVKLGLGRRSGSADVFAVQVFQWAVIAIVLVVGFSLPMVAKLRYEGGTFQERFIITFVSFALFALGGYIASKLLTLALGVGWRKIQSKANKI